MAVGQEEGPFLVGGNSFPKPKNGRIVVQNLAFSVVGERNTGLFRVEGMVESSNVVHGVRGQKEIPFKWEIPVRVEGP
jgi:hypothetical protein